MADNVQIISGDISHLEEGFICLESGERIPSDVILCGTGWVPSLQFFTETQCRELGLPHPVGVEETQWKALGTEADAKVFATFPQLKSSPEHYHTPVTHTPYRLYRHIAPIWESGKGVEDRSIVFIGQVGVGNYFPSVECQALWATAYLDGRLALPGKEEQEREVALFTAWCRRRYLSKGDEGNNMTFELIGYIDTLLGDLGLTSHRKDG